MAYNDATTIYWGHNHGYPSSQPMAHSNSSGSTHYGSSQGSIGSTYDGQYAHRESMLYSNPRTSYRYGSYSSQTSELNGNYPMSPSASSSYTQDSGYFETSADHDCVSPQLLMFPEPYYSSQNPPYPAEIYTNDIPVPASAGKQNGQQRYPCTIPGCKSTGQFKRPTDLQRHVSTVHYPQPFDCQFVKSGRCHRSGKDGFTRRDHYQDHLRDVHCKDIPKAGKGESSKATKRR